MKDDSDALMGLFMVLVGISLLIAVSTLAAVVWLIISAIGMQLRRDYLAKKALERFEERLAREGGNVPIDDVFVAMGIGGVEVNDEVVDDDDFLGGIILGMGGSVDDG